MTGNKNYTETKKDIKALLKLKFLRMKKLLIITCLLGSISTASLLTSCSSKRDPGRIYMPDMTYSRAYETYDYRDSAVFTTDIRRRGGNFIYFDNKPVSGTVKRGELYPYVLPNDSSGYARSAGVTNPIGFMTGAEMGNAQRLYNIHCGVCHGEKATGDGPVAAKVAGVANLTGDVYVSMTDGTMFHSITYGKGVMGSYSSQLTREQRWQVIKYIRTLQKPVAGTTAPADTTTQKG
jgi:cytochrome c553